MGFEPMTIRDLVVAFSIVDYDGPLSEAGDTTAKYHALKAIIKSYATENSSKLT